MPGPFIPRAEHTGWGPPAFSHDSRLIAVPVSRHQLRVAETETGRTIAHLSTLQPLQVWPLAFSPDGSRLIASTNQKTALIWDLRRIREQLRTDGPGLGPAAVSRRKPRPRPNRPIRSIRVVGEVLEPSARRDAELTALDMRLRDQPEDGDSLIQRGWLRLQMGKASEALADLERGVRLRPDDTDALFLLAEAQSRTNNAAACHATLSRYLARSPDDVDARLLHARVAVSLGQTQIAVEEFSRVLEADPEP